MVGLISPVHARVPFALEQLATVFGARDHDAWHARRTAARDAIERSGSTLPSHQLVYGELQIEALATVLDAAGVRVGDSFIDIGSGDGMSVLATALLCGESLTQCAGLEVIQPLVHRSVSHRDTLLANVPPGTPLPPIRFLEGDVHDASSGPARALVGESTLAVCFATTWSHDGQSKRRELPRLSCALTAMPAGARVIMVDGRLLKEDGWQWQGDLKISNADVAPYSTASLFERMSAPPTIGARTGSASVD